MREEAKIWLFVELSPILIRRMTFLTIFNKIKHHRFLFHHLSISIGKLFFYDDFLHLSIHHDFCSKTQTLDNWSMKEQQYELSMAFDQRLQFILYKSDVIIHSHSPIKFSAFSAKHCTEKGWIIVLRLYFPETLFYFRKP